MLLRSLGTVLLFILLLQGCGAQKQQPKPQPHPQKIQQMPQEPVAVAPPQPIKPSLHVIAPQDSVIKILNIKPKYYDGIELEHGNYHIEVTKKGYESYTKWLTIDKPLTLKVKLKKTLTLPPFVWSYDHQDFYTQYDPKTELIWALPSAYVDYVELHDPKELLPKTIDAVSREWPKIDRTKLDTIISNQNDNLTIYYKSKRDSSKKFYSSFSKLEINGDTNKWRIPTQKEILLNNPFKKYQQYYQLIWNKGNLVKMNVPTLYLNDAKQRAALCYKKNKTLYSGSPSERIKTIAHPENISVVTPVRKIESQKDKIIYDQEESLEQKFQKLYKQLGSSEKTIKALLGDLKLKNIAYDKKRKKLTATLYSTTNNFQKDISFKVDADKFTDLKEAMLEQRVIPHVKLAFKNGTLSYKSLSLKTNKVEEKQDYLEAKRTQNINFYREFIRIYPQSHYSKKLQQLIELEYKNKYKTAL